MEEHSHQQKYYCPMKCEGDKTYDKPGNCPVCGMHLVPVGENKKHELSQHEPLGGGNEHKHKHQEHKHEANKDEAKGKYYCPMRCEGDKMYDKPGDCPVCGMHLMKEESTSPSKVTYTCPMHPEVKQDHPGNCPKCGMTLVPEKGEETQRGGKSL